MDMGATVETTFRGINMDEKDEKTEKLRKHESWWQKKAPRDFLERWSEDRRPLFQYLQKIVDPNVTILDAGGGPGKLYPWLKDKAKEYTIIDITPKFIDWLHEDYPEVNAIEGSILDMSMFKDNQFDVGMAVSIIEHLKPEDMPTAIRELMRVCKKLIISWFIPPTNDKTWFKDRWWVGTRYNQGDVDKAIGKPYKKTNISRFVVYEINSA